MLYYIHVHVNSILNEDMYGNLFYCSNDLHVTCTCTSDFLISFEAWAKLAQKWLVCAPLRINLEPIN